MSDVGGSTFSRVMSTVSATEHVTVMARINPSKSTTNSSLTLVLLLHGLNGSTGTCVHETSLNTPSMVRKYRLFSSPSSFSVSSSLIVTLSYTAIGHVDAPLFTRGVTSFGMIGVSRRRAGPKCNTLGCVITNNSSANRVV